MAYVQRGTALPAGFAALLQQGTVSDPSEEPKVEPCPGKAENLHHGQRASSRSVEAAPSARAPVPERQRAIQQKAQSKVSGGDNFTPATGSIDGAVPPLPDALSWFLCTDEIVKPVTWETVTRCKAYILLYMRTH